MRQYEPCIQIIIRIEKKNIKFKSGGTDGQKFQNYFRVFLDSTESPLSLESGHMPVNSILCSHIF